MSITSENKIANKREGLMAQLTARCSGGWQARSSALPWCSVTV